MGSCDRRPSAPGPGRARTGLCFLPMGPEWIVVGVVVLVLFGGSQLPKLAKGLGSAQREFKKGLEDGADDEDDKK
jgi:sec-independent protein translocase protein TatA